MELYTDTYYIKRVQEGDIASFACLLDKYSRQVHTLIRRVVQSREDAEELTQDVFIKVFRSLNSFKGDSTFSTWVYRIAYNTAISHVRKKKSEFLAIDEMQLNNVSEEEVDILLGRTDSSERVQLLERALKELPPDERAMILLFYMQEKSVEDITEITNLSASNVKTKLFRIRKKLFVIIKKLEERLDE